MTSPTTPPDKPSSDHPADQPSPGRRGSARWRGARGRVAGAAQSASARVDPIRRRAEERIAAEEASSRKGVAIGWFARFRDAQLNSLLLAAYLFLTLVPAMIVISSYVNSDPRVVATHLVTRLNLTGATANLVRDVLGGASVKKLTAALIAVVSVVVFGLGIGRTLQTVYARVWRIPEPEVSITENVRYFAWLGGLVVGGALFVIELSLLKEADNWIEWVSAPLWIAGIVAFFTWTPVFLLHRRITWRDALPGALAIAVGLVGIRLLSSVVFTNWLNWYAEYYGGIGIAIALFFWLGLTTSVFIAGAAVAPAYAVRRQARAVHNGPR